MEPAERLRQRVRLRSRLDVVHGALLAACPQSAAKELAYVSPQYLHDEERALLVALKERLPGVVSGSRPSAKEASGMARDLILSLRRDRIYDQLLRQIEDRNVAGVERQVEALRGQGLSLRERAALDDMRREMLLSGSGDEAAQARARSIARRLLYGA